MITIDKKADPTNPVLLETIELLEQQTAPVWKAVADNLGKTNRTRPEVNISDVQRVADDGDTVVVPGKLLGAGFLDKDVTVAAFQASNSAREKVDEQGEFMFIDELVEENPDGEEVRIVK